MAAYAALVSVTHIIDQIKQHPRPPVSLPVDLVESLTENVTFLQEFLEQYSLQAVYSNEADPLEMRIMKVAYAAEDVIESHIADHILGSTSSVDLNEGLQKVIVEMEAIKRKVMEIHLKNSSLSSGSVTREKVTSSSVAHNTVMVGFDDILLDMLDKLTGAGTNLQILPIVGMGGVEFNTLEILKVILSQVNKCSSEHQIGEQLYKHLYDRRYLIVMDDLWSVDAWDEIKFYFPDNENGSRIMVTTRLSSLADRLTGSLGFRMKFLTDDKGWSLLCQIVFGKEDCPIELEKIGKKIVRNCKGLPLSIVVIGRLLAKYKGEREHWEHILENTSSAISFEDEEHCLQILYMSYKELPVHLKPCFLYLGIFPEDSVIRVSELIELAVAEGFLKPIYGKSSEEVAEEYLMELIHRNVIMVYKLGSNGKAKLCEIHDIVRDLCLREAQKQKFLCIRSPHSLCNPQRVINDECRIIIHESTAREDYDPAQVLNVLQSASLARSLMISYESDDFEKVVQQTNHRLLRVFKMEKTYNYNKRSFYLNHKLCNLRYFSTEGTCVRLKLSGEFHWNLQTVLSQDMSVVKFTEIWQMSLLRCVKFKHLSLPNPSGLDERDEPALRNLHMLSKISISNLCENVVERISNIKKLRICVDDGESLECYNNLQYLHELQHLKCRFVYLENAITLPHSLKKLTLQSKGLGWEVLTAMIGPLPFLEVLKLKSISSAGSEWRTSEGQFCSHRFLLIEQCRDLKCWNTDGEHFPRLEHLRLKYLDKLEGIPQSIGDIPTLQSIVLNLCSVSAEASAERILEEQKEYGNEGLRVEIIENLVLKYLRSRPRLG